MTEYSHESVIFSDGYECGREREREMWTEAFRAYRDALAKPYFKLSPEDRKVNEQDVAKAFEALVQLQEHRD